MSKLLKSDMLRGLRAYLRMATELPCGKEGQAIYQSAADLLECFDWDEYVVPFDWPERTKNKVQWLYGQSAGDLCAFLLACVDMHKNHGMQHIPYGVARIMVRMCREQLMILDEICKDLDEYDFYRDRRL